MTDVAVLSKVLETPSWPLSAFGGSKRSLACGCITPDSASSSHGLLLVFVSSLLPLIKTLVIGFRAHLDNPLISRSLQNVITSTRTLFPNKVILRFQVGTYLGGAGRGGGRGTIRQPMTTSKYQTFSDGYGLLDISLLGDLGALMRKGQTHSWRKAGV